MYFALLIYVLSFTLVVLVVRAVMIQTLFLILQKLNYDINQNGGGWYDTPQGRRYMYHSDFE